MKRRHVPRWRQVLGKMAANLGAIVGKFNGSANGAQIIDLSGPGRPAKSKARHKRKHKR
jgi:hypothetical protein